MNQEATQAVGKNIRKKSIVREYVESLIIAIILALFIRTFIVQAFKIPSGSMKDTLLIGDHILVNKFIYGIGIPFTDIKFFGISSPQRGDVIVFKFPKDETKDFIKRVVGVPGDKVMIVSKKVFVNGRPINESLYVKHMDRNIFSRSTEHVPKKIKRDQMSSITVPENSYFVMGDNRDNSEDSRFWGFVQKKKIKGKAFIIYFSWDSNNHSVIPWGWVRFRRLGNLIH